MTERLIDAVLSLRYQQIEALLRRAVPINAKNRLGQTPVMVACFIPDEDKSYRMFKFLLKKGADILETDNSRTSVFQHACQQGRGRIARKIVKEMGVAAADLAGTNLIGHSPLFDAVTSGNVDLVRFIVKLMRDRSMGVDTPDKSGTTPLIQAHKMGLADVAAVLEKDGHANPRICDRERHMNATQWAEEAALRRLRAQALLKERTREHKMIYSRFPDRPKGHSYPSVTAKKSPSLPDIRPRWHKGTMNTKSDIIGGKDWNRDAKRIAERNSNSWVVRRSLDLSGNPSATRSNSSVMNRSVDTAMAMLDLASRTSEERYFAKSFVSSEFDTSKASEYGNLKFASVGSLLTTYSSQFSSNFRKPAKPPPEPIPEMPVYEKKSSTLAYIMGRGPKSKRRRSSKRGSSHHRYHHPRDKQLSSKNCTLKVTSRRSSASSTDSGVKSSTSRGSSGSMKRSPTTWTQPQDELPNQELSDGDGPSPGSTSRSTRSRKVHNEREKESDAAGETRGKSKTLQPPKLSRVPEDDQVGERQVLHRLNPRDSLPDIRVTVPSV
ncbi:uncharacterized protein LOC110980895 [Acanthaster planci]|uniref:Uncharacterized protein LOC110980895 n=1 Tax=Acanthaster planci TaxID=133434 RepID=A0A8B7YK62_ACAPL|nr:uncharacterized protein LOC110980895 [Acanthaster planci]